jgi:hypothetical protein
MNEFDVLGKIATSLTERKSTAALSNYGVLCNNIKFVNDTLKYSIRGLECINPLIETLIKDESSLKPDFRYSANLNPFTKIFPRIIENGILVSEKFSLYTEADNRNGINTHNLHKLHRGFMEYNHLVTSARQYFDDIISNSYQLVLLDPKSLNYHVLISLNSFNKFATKSLKNCLFNSDIISILQEFEKIPFKNWDKSAITQCNHSTFAQKVDYLSNVFSITDTSLINNLKNVFKFSSEFTHIGYISTFFSSSFGSEVIFGDDIGPYLPSTENFSELKYELLELGCNLFRMIFLPSIIKALDNIFIIGKNEHINNVIKYIQCDIETKLKTRNSEYYFFIKNGLISSKEKISFTCMCGATFDWKPPHESHELYCKKCGSHFNLIEVSGEGGYVITSSGPVKIIGSDVPDFVDLPVDEQIQMLKEVEKLYNESIGK